ncbi:hypothetical protein Tco_1414480 [Tanacetum coccineum]
MLKSELEKPKQEKESNQLKIENFDNASKSLDKLIGSQIPDKSRKGLGFVSYNVVPPPPTWLFLSPNLDLSNSGLEEFQQPEFEGYGPKTSKIVNENASNEVMESLEAPMVEKSSIRQETEVPQPSSPPHTNVVDEAASTHVDVRHEGAATTVTSLDARQPSGNIDKTPTMPHDSPLPRVNTLGSDEGNLKQTKQIYGTAFTKLIKNVMKLEKTVKTKQTKKKARIGVSDDEEYLEDPSKQGRNIAKIHQDPDISLFTATEEVYTAKKGVSIAEPVSTVGASVSTASASSTKYKGKAIIEEAETIQTKSKLQQEQERLKWEDIQARIEVDEELAQRLQAEEREKYSEAEKARLLAELINKKKRHFAQQ